MDAKEEWWAKMPVNLAEQIPSESIAVKTSAQSWEEVIEIAGDLLVAGGATTDAYTQEMIETVISLGPYIVIAPGFALAHSRPSPAVLKTGLSLATLIRGVDFGSKNDPVRLVVGLAALDHDAHLEVMKALAKLLSDPAKVDALCDANTVEEVQSILSS